jgi:hypothetical protein
VTTLPVDKRTLAVLRWPELGFLGFVMPTFRQTPFISGRPRTAGETGRRAFLAVRGEARTWLSVLRTRGVVLKRRVVLGRSVVDVAGDNGWETLRAVNAAVLLLLLSGHVRVRERRARRSRSEGADAIVAMGDVWESWLVDESEEAGDE